MSDSSPPDNAVTRNARLDWVPIKEMTVSALAQRDLNPGRVEHLRLRFDVEQIGTPTVSYRDGRYYIIDGHHRIEAMRQLGWEDQQVQCWILDGLEEIDEAERFLSLNDVLSVPALPRFKVAVVAGRPEEVEVDAIVRSADLVVTRDKVPGAVSAVSTLLKVYNRSGSAVLRRTLEIIRDAYGDEGFEAPVIDGISLVCQRYNGQVDDDSTTKALRVAHGGVAGLLNRAEHLRRTTGNAKGHCVAAAAVDILNRTAPRGDKLPNWWQPPKPRAPKAAPKPKRVTA